MNQLIICIIVLLSSQTVLAEKLYRWIEPDGSITFSPTPPPSGVEYKAVEATGNNVAQTGQGDPLVKSKPSILATSEHDPVQQRLPVNETVVSARPAPAIASPRVSYAPDTGSGITRSASVPAGTSPAQAPAGTSNIQTISSDTKRRHCQDLSKRVISLEQRLRSNLQPNDMDNTVIAMARYQRSYDQHCIR